MTGARKVKRVPATMWEPAFEVEIEPILVSARSDEFAVYLDGVKIGELTSFTTQSERKVGGGSRLVTRGPRFKAWATRTTREGDRFDYFRQHRSMSAAIRTLVAEVKATR